MRRAAIATASTGAMVVLLLTLKPHQGADAAGGGSAAQGAAPAPTGGTSDGSHPGHRVYTGDPVQTQYGTVQVAATVKGGKLRSVKVLQAPSQAPRSQQITARAVPKLKQESLSARSAHIDAVSGASYTSKGYVKSLQSALDKARA